MMMMMMMMLLGQTQKLGRCENAQYWVEVAATLGYKVEKKMRPM